MGLLPKYDAESFDGLINFTVPQAPGAPGAAPSHSQAPIPQAQQQYGRFGQPGVHDAPQKSSDPFAQQGSQPPFDTFPSQASQAQSQQPGGPFSSAPSDYSSYYTANERNPYNYYGQHFGQQQSAQGQDTLSGQRPFGAYNTSQQSDNLSQYPQSAAGVHGQPRFGGAGNDNQNSGHSTPNPTAQAAAQGQQAQQGQQGQQQPGAPGSQPQSHGQGQGYPNYNHPYYSNPYYHQYYSGYGQGGFAPYGKAGMYNQPYGVSPNAPFDHTNSPAFAQSSLHRDSGLSDYGRAGSTQGSGAPGLGGGSSSFGNVHDSFGARGSSSFQSQGQGFNSQTQPGNPSANDDLKPYDSKSGAGPSPSLGGARPGSATAVNSTPSTQGGLPPQGSQIGAGGYAGYPSHLQGHGLHGSNAYGIGGAGGANQHGNTPYGSYGQGGFGGGGYYGGGQQQQRGGGGGGGGGWGGNYH